MKGNNTNILELFCSYAEGETELEAVIVSRVLDFALECGQKDDARGLVEASKRFPRSFQRVLDIALQKLEVPEGFLPLLNLYREIRDSALAMYLARVRDWAIANDKWTFLEQINEAGLTQELAELGRFARTGSL